MHITLISNIAQRAPKLSLKISRQHLQLKKQSPHIFFGAGLVGSVASTVLACRATLKLNETLSGIEEDLEMARKPQPELNPDAERNVTRVYINSAGRLVKLYAPSVVVGGLSVAALSGAHVQMSRRNTGLMAAYASVAAAYENYRMRVATELGEEREMELFRNQFSVTRAETGEVVPMIDENGRSPYARCFDEASRHYEKNAELNRLYLQCQQNWMNEKLRAQGYLFLNDVYDALGFDATPAGQVVGWVIKGDGDNYVDFGVWEAANANFIEGWEPSVWLDFNVDGVIYDKI